MALKVYRGKQFEHTHENFVFNELMDLLEIHCSSKPEYWYLVGNFFVGSREIDALLVKPNAIIVIDFKDYSGVLSYSEDGPWRIGDVEVRGGASVNPLVQLRLNRKALSDFFKNYYPSLNCDWNHIAATTVFHNDIIFDQSVIKPPINRWFYISDINRAVRDLDAIVSRKIYMTPDIMDGIVSYFGLDEYTPDDAIKTKRVVKKIEVEEHSGLELTRNQRQVLNEFLKWLDNKTEVFSITGMVSTGKKTLLQYMITAIKSKNLKPVILTSNARRALEYQHFGAEVMSVYAWLYSNHPTSFEKVDGRKRAVYGVKNEIDLKDIVPIFVEAQLFSDEEFKISDIRYGSGRLISDLLNLFKSKGHSFAVIGDPYQLVKGSIQRSLITESKYKEVDLKVFECILGEQILMNRENDVLPKFQLNIVEGLIKERFSYLPNIFGGNLIIDKDNNEKWFPDTKNTRAESVLLCGTHKQVASINSYCKTVILEHANGHMLAAGDRIDFYNRTPILYDENEEYEQPYLSWINAGSLGLVESVDDATEEHSILLKGRDNPIALNFKKASCFVSGMGQVKFRYLVNFFESEIPELENDYYIALQVLARKLSKYDLDRYRSELPDKQDAGYNEAYKKYEKHEYQILQSKGYLTAALIRLAHAMTVHRAQGRLWPNVWINAERSASSNKPNNSDYYRWLYTATTCTIEELIIQKMPRLDPLVNSKIIRAHDFNLGNINRKKGLIYDAMRLPSELEKNIKKPCGFKNNKLLPLYLELLNRLEKSDWKISSWQEYDYQIVIAFLKKAGNNEVRIRLHYNKQFAITNVVNLSGAEDDINDVRNIIDKKFSPASEPMLEAFTFVEKLLMENGFKIIFGVETNYRLCLTIEKENDIVEVEFNIKKDGMVSSIRILKATSEDITCEFEKVMGDWS